MWRKKRGVLIISSRSATEDFSAISIKYRMKFPTSSGWLTFTHLWLNTRPSSVKALPGQVDLQSEVQAPHGS